MFSFDFYVQNQAFSFDCIVKKKKRKGIGWTEGMVEKKSWEKKKGEWGWVDEWWWGEG